MNQEIELKLNRLVQIKSKKEIEQKEKMKRNMIELKRLKGIINDLGYLNVYLNIYLKNTNKKDNLKNIQQYINQNIDVWLRDGHRI